jgi:hypothetical protein
MVVIVWYLYLQLPVQSVTITTKQIMWFWFRSWRGVLNTTLHVIKFVSELRQVGGFLCVFHHDISEISLKVALNTITLTHIIRYYLCPIFKTWSIKLFKLCFPKIIYTGKVIKKQRKKWKEILLCKENWY